MFFLCDDLLVFLFYIVVNWISFDFWSVGQTKQDIWGLQAFALINSDAFYHSFLDFVPFSD